MQLEEFTKLGCIDCGHHEFTPTGPIEHDGYTRVTCTFCEREYDRDFIGPLDSITWEQLYKEAHGEVFVDPVQTRYHNEEQFIDKFVENVDGEVSSTTD